MDISFEENWLRESLASEPKWLQNSVLANFGIEVSPLSPETEMVPLLTVSRDAEIVLQCHEMYHKWHSGRATRDTAYRACQRLIKELSEASILQCGSIKCWFCGAGNPQSFLGKTCFLCDAPLRHPFFCRHGWHKWQDAYIEYRYLYRECRICHARGYMERNVSGYQPVNRQWLDGGAWINPPPSLKGIKLQSAVLPPPGRS